MQKYTKKVKPQKNQAMITQQQIKSLTKAIDKLNADYAAYVKETEETELPEIDTTCIGWSPVEPYTYKELKTKFKVTDFDSNEYSIEDEWDLDEVKMSIMYDRRRLKKAWRIWKSENPDWELEHDTEDDE